MSGKVWKITGYVGFSDCDGPEDYNLINYIVLMNDFLKRLQKNLCVTFTARNIDMQKLMLLIKLTKELVI